MNCIFFNNITTLEKLFYDGFCQRIISIDLSHFNSSLVTSTAYMIHSCSSLNEISFTNFNTSSITNMEFMFYKADRLLLLDLSNFDTSKVSNMTNMFSYCYSLQYLDISNFYFGNSIEAKNMFDRDSNLKYVKIYNAKNYYNYLEFCKYYFVINQKENFIYNKNPSYGLTLANCNTNKKPYECDANNYIIVKYNKKVEYSSGFYSTRCPSRYGISFIINQDVLIGKTHYFIIEANASMQIHFNSPITSLEDFFNGEKDRNSQNIISIDLSHFNSSLITNKKICFINALLWNI